MCPKSELQGWTIRGVTEDFTTDGTLDTKATYLRGQLMGNCSVLVKRKYHGGN